MGDPCITKESSTEPIKIINQVESHALPVFHKQSADTGMSHQMQQHAPKPILGASLLESSLWAALTAVPWGLDATEE